MRDIAILLARLDAIDRELRRLEAEKEVVRQEFVQHLAPGERTFPLADGGQAKVILREDTEIEYDQALLSQRLGERYVRVLKPDPKLVRQHWDLVAPLLEPVLAQVGTVDRERVKAAVEAGICTREDFAGAFTKTVERSLRIAFKRSSDQP